MRKYILKTAVTLIMITCLTACSNHKDKPASVEPLTVTPAGQQDITGALPENTYSPTVSPTASPEASGTASVSGVYSRDIVKDGDILYSKAKNRILSLNLTDGTETVLYEAAQNETIQSYLIYNDRVYFLGNYYQGDQYYTDLCMVNTDGTGMQQLLENIFCGSQIYIYKDQLYLPGYSGPVCYSLNEDGSLKEQIDNKDSAYQYLSVNDSELWTNGTLTVPYCLDHYNLIWVKEFNRDLVCINPEDGSRKIYQARSNVEAITKDYIISSVYVNDNNIKTYYLTDIKTGEERQWFADTLSAQFIDYDASGCYFSFSSEDFLDYTYKKIAWDGTQQTIFTQSVVPGMYDETLTGVKDLTVIDDTIYYHYADQDKMYLMSRKLSVPEQVNKLGNYYGDKMYSKFGHVEAYADKLYSDNDPKKAILNIYSERLVFDGTSAAVNKINQRLTQLQKTAIDGMATNARRDEKFLTEDADRAYLISSTVSGITYSSDRYVCIYQSEYDDTLGAHGMPYRMYYIFDLETGNQLTLKDIVGNGKKEIHDIILEYFVDAIADYPASFFEDAADTVDQYAGFDTPFYLTNDGIVFYYGPYNIASYAAGFKEVTVPYSEFDLKINLAGVDAGKTLLTDDEEQDLSVLISWIYQSNLNCPEGDDTKILLPERIKLLPTDMDKMDFVLNIILFENIYRAFRDNSGICYFTDKDADLIAGSAVGEKFGKHNDDYVSYADGTYSYNLAGGDGASWWPYIAIDKVTAVTGNELKLEGTLSSEHDVYPDKYSFHFTAVVVKNPKSIFGGYTLKSLSVKK